MSSAAEVAMMVPFLILALGIWLGLVFYADAHPGRSSRPSLEAAGDVSVDDSGQGHGEQAPPAVRRAA